MVDAYVGCMVDAYVGCMVPAWGTSHCMGWDSFYIQLVLKIMTPSLTDLAFLTGLYSEMVQELASQS